MVKKKWFGEIFGFLIQYIHSRNCFYIVRQTVKDMLNKNPVILVHLDTSKQYAMITDASSDAIGGISGV